LGGGKPPPPPPPIKILHRLVSTHKMLNTITKMNFNINIDSLIQIRVSEI